MRKKQRVMSEYRKCLVIDTAYMPRAVISTERAFVIHYKGNAEIIVEHPEAFGLVRSDLEILKPSVIKIKKYINIPFHKVALTRENVFKRDNYECVYCGAGRKSILTLDHVIPKSKGGKDSWENLVTACKPCNSEKDDLSLEEWGKENPNPKKPHYLMLMKSVTSIPEEWEKYLFV